MGCMTVKRELHQCKCLMLHVEDGITAVLSAKAAYSSNVLFGPKGGAFELTFRLMTVLEASYD